MALPQGLVASGFFANIALHDFELGLRDAFGQAIDADGRLILRDACYYVDDIRLVLEIERGLDETLIEEMTMQWLASLLQESAPGLLVDAGKQRRLLKAARNVSLCSSQKPRIEFSGKHLAPSTRITELI